MFLRNVLLVLVLIVMTIAGCATVPTIEEFPYSTVSLNNRAYFALVQLCDREGILWDYDSLSQVILLKKADKEWKLLIGSSRMMAQGAVVELLAPVEIHDSVIYAPVELRNLIVPPPPKSQAVPQAPTGIFLRSINTVILDSGHGGKDPGAIGRYGLKEKEVVLDIAKKAKERLEVKGLRVYLTRDRDEFIALASRPRMAEKQKGDLFISIHANANRSRRLDGLEVYYLSEAVDDNARAVAAAENAALALDDPASAISSFSLKALLWDMINTENRKESIELARWIGEAVSREMNLRLLAVKGASFAVLKGATVPSVLVEIGYISNSEGEKRMRDPDYRQKMAEAIADGIMNFKNYSEGKRGQNL